MEIFAKRLKKLRKENKLSQKELANMLGVTDKAVYLWEKGEREPSFKLAMEIAKIFGVSTDYLCGLEDEKEELNEYEM